MSMTQDEWEEEVKKVLYKELDKVWKAIMDQAEKDLVERGFGKVEYSSKENTNKFV